MIRKIEIGEAAEERRTVFWKCNYTSARTKHGISFQEDYFGGLQKKRRRDLKMTIHWQIQTTMKYTCQMYPSRITWSYLMQRAWTVYGRSTSQIRWPETLTSVNKLVGYHIRSDYSDPAGWYLSFLISNTVTMGITVRREEIAIMKYIGAKDGFVRAPFVFEGLLIGVIGAIIPLVMLYFMYDKAVSYVMTRYSLLNNIVDFLPVMRVYRTLLPVGIALGVGIGFLGSTFTIRKHLKV